MSDGEDPIQETSDHLEVSHPFTSAVGTCVLARGGTFGCTLREKNFNQQGTFAVF